MTIQTRNEVRKLLKLSGWNASLRSKQGKWYVLEPKLKKNRWRSRWLKTPIFANDLEAYAFLYWKRKELDYGR